MQLRLAVIVLAAGASERYGDNKLVSAHPSGSSLIEHVVDACRPHCTFQLPVVVTGRWHGPLNRCLDTEVCRCVYNSQWHQGMGTSIACGVNAMLVAQKESADIASGRDFPSHVLVVLGDLPLITTASLGSLVNAMYEHPDRIIVSEWQQKCTVPAIFPAEYFPLLQGLSGDAGARNIIRHARLTQSHSILAIPHPEAGVDIDTPDSWQALPS